MSVIVELLAFVEIVDQRARLRDDVIGLHGQQRLSDLARPRFVAAAGQCDRVVQADFRRGVRPGNRLQQRQAAAHLAALDQDPRVRVGDLGALWRGFVGAFGKRQGLRFALLMFEPSKIVEGRGMRRRNLQYALVRGMRSSSVAKMRAMTSLSSGLPGTTAGLLSGRGAVASSK
jgi:hypothetical protein